MNILSCALDANEYNTIDSLSLKTLYQKIHHSKTSKMVKVKNTNSGRGENVEEGGSSRGRIGKGKKVASGWTRKRRKIAPGHRVDLNDMEGIEIIQNLFNNIGWRTLLIVNELFYPEMIYEVYANLHKGRVQKHRNIFYQWVLSRVGGRDIAFDDRLLNHILETRDDDIIFYTKNKKCYDPNLYSERRFKEIFTKREVLKRHDDRNINKLDSYGRLLHHMISNIIIPNVGHKSFITNMQSFVMLAQHEHRRMNFGYMAIEHMLATQTSFTKCLPYGFFLKKVFQYFVLNLVGVSDAIGVGKMYNKHTFKRMGSEKNKEGMLVRGGQDESDEDDEGNEEQEAMNMDEEESEEEPEEESFRRK
ncbi:hypothetical protein M9H77_11721 [Catharanthus roseus]|uniref:Uncharacterized protein n=1 Tax=Catharanthus roseus TaxID=4058 RepID=A0ACC0BFF8_CATRO|nr:hypothetical protein M9H77_11721 [Catharanthus roseus]